jgi:hypothetical protein
VRDGVERRLRGDGENLVVEGRWLHLLASRVLEARQPVVDQALAAFAEPCVCTAELLWLLSGHAGFDRDERQQTAADQHREPVTRPPERERHSDWSDHEAGALARKPLPVS